MSYVIDERLLIACSTVENRRALIPKAFSCACREKQKRRKQRITMGAYRLNVIQLNII